MIDTSLFPYSSFPVRLEIKEENKIAWFKDEIDLEKHLTRYKLDKRKIKVQYRDEQSVKSSKSSKAKVRSRTTKSSNGSTTTNRRSTKKLDPSGNTGGTRKSKSVTKSKPKKSK